MDEVFFMTNPHRLDDFLGAAQRVLISQGMEPSGKWLDDILASRLDLVRLVAWRGQYVLLPRMALVDEIKARHGADLIGAYHRVTRGIPEER
jgi:hypothetical protein